MTPDACKTAIEEHVRPRLEDTFGKAVAMLIMISASNAVGMPLISPTKEGYLKFVKAVVEDQRVRDMWGVSGCTDQLVRWSSIV